MLAREKMDIEVQAQNKIATAAHFTRAASALSQPLILSSTVGRIS